MKKHPEKSLSPRFFAGPSFFHVRHQHLPLSRRWTKLTILDLNENIFLIEGDIIKTVPDFINRNKQIRISLLHIDVDLYEPTKVSLENFFPHVVKGGVIVLDDYGAFPGANKAIEEYFDDKNYKIEQFRYSHSISFIIKK